VRKKAVDSMLSVQQTSTIGSAIGSAISGASISSSDAFSVALSSVALSEHVDAAEIRPAQLRM
jgi:hypothetical protein